MLVDSIPKERRDPRVNRTLQLLEQALAQLLNEKTFQSITVHDIALRAGINRATFYAHFPDKYALLDYKIRQDFQAEIEKRTLNTCHFSVDNLRALMLAVCDFVSENHGQCKSPRSQFEPLMERQVKAQIQELLTAWLEAVASTVPKEIAAAAGSWAIYGLAQYWNHEKERQPLNEFIEQVLPLAKGIFM